MGMEQAFSADKSNFSELANPCRGLRLHAVTQAAAIKVDEEGTVATAAPGSKGRPAKAGLSNILKVRVDHPFLYVIVDKADQNTFLFIGHINNPVLNAWKGDSWKYIYFLRRSITTTIVLKKRRIQCNNIIQQKISYSFLSESTIPSLIWLRPFIAVKDVLQ